MSVETLLSPGDYELEIRGVGGTFPLDSPLFRLQEGEALKIRLTLRDGADQNVKKVFLHTDCLGRGWERSLFHPCEDGNYELEILPERDGAFRFAVEKGEGLLWEPDVYHRVFVDSSAVEGLRFYTLIPNISGTIKDWILRLDEIKAMGFSAVHILPFTKMGASQSPYSAADLFSVDPRYGSREDFRTFCRRAEELGILICLDIVLNHVGVDSNLCVEHGGWIQPDRSREDGFRRAGCYHHNDWISWEDLALLNYDHPDPEQKQALYACMLDYIKTWGEIAADSAGRFLIRLDNLHSSNRPFVTWVLSELRKAFPKILVLAEFFGSTEVLEQGVMDYGLNLLTGNSWEYPFAPVLEGFLQGIHASSFTKYLLAPVSHDTESVSRLFGHPLSAIPRYGACALMGTGATGIVQGFEDGLPEKVNFIGEAGGALPETNLDFRGFIARVNQLLEAEPCLRRKGNAHFHATENESLIVCLRRDSQGENILIAANFDILETQTCSFPLEDPELQPLLFERGSAGYHKDSASLLINLEPCGIYVIRIKS